MAEKQRRGRGEGGLFQLHTPECPPPDEDGDRPHHKCTGPWRVVLVDEYGNRVYRRARTKAKAQAKLNAARQEIAEHGAAVDARMTVEKWLRYWLDDVAKPRLKPTTYATYRTEVYEHLIPFIGRIHLNRLARRHIRQLHRDLERTKLKIGKTSKTLSISSVRSAHAVLSSALEDAVRDELIRVNVAKGERPRGEATIRGHLTTEAARQLLSATADDRLGSRWIFAALSGCRQGERLGLCWDQVDLDGMVADISWQLREIPWSHGCDGGCGQKARSCPQRMLDIPEGRWEWQRLHGQLVLLRPKRGSQRVIPLIPPLVAALRKRHTAYLAERDGYDIDHGLVWCHPDGRPVHKRVDHTQWRAALKAAGLPHIELHGLRHTTASLLDELGVHEGVVQQILGHSRVTTTRGYTHRDLTQARNALLRLGQALQLESVHEAE